MSLLSKSEKILEVQEPSVSLADPNRGFVSLWGWEPWDPGVSPLRAFPDVVLPPLGSAKDHGTVPTCGAAVSVPCSMGGHWQKLSPFAPAPLGHLL